MRLRAELVRTRGGRAEESVLEQVGLQADLAAPHAAEALWAAFDEHADGLDVPVNNAGVAVYGRVNEVAEEDFDPMFAVNVKAGAKDWAASQGVRGGRYQNRFERRGGPWRFTELNATTTWSAAEPVQT